MAAELRAVQMGPQRFEGLAEAEVEPVVLPTDAEIAAEPGGVPLATMALIEAAAARAGAATAEEYTVKEIGASFSFRLITGDELAACRKLATVTRMVGKPAVPDKQVDEAKFAFLLVNKASVAPKIDGRMWAALGRCGAMVQSSIQAFVQEINGMTVDAGDEAKNDSSESQI